MLDFVMIVAGGKGSRMGSEIPKQFLPILGIPLLMHTFRVFHSYNAELKIILTLPPDHIEYWQKLCHQHRFDIPHQIMEGGEQRFFSVKKGLAAIHGNGITAIHDGVRPLVSLATIDRCFKTAREKGNAIPVMGVTESLRMKQDQDSFPLDRDKYFMVQTPQVFDTNELLKAYEQPFHPSFTDDATVLEKYGKKINLVDGNRENIKITTPIDIMMAEIILKTNIK